MLTFTVNKIWRGIKNIYFLIKQFLSGLTNQVVCEYDIIECLISSLDSSKKHYILCSSSVLSAAIYLCPVTPITIMHFTLCMSCGGLNKPLYVRTCFEVECVGLNGARVDPVCPELASLSTLLCPLKLKIGLGLQALSLHTAHCYWTTLDSQHNSTLSAGCPLYPVINILDLCFIYLISR